MIDPLFLLIDGRRYGGWTSARVTRGLTRCATDFEIEVSERWAGQSQPWQILPFAKCEIFAGADRLMTGYVDRYAASGSATTHSVRITGRSKTMDLIDCMPDIASGQFSGYTLAAIARAIAAVFGIEVVVQTPHADRTIPNANLEPAETAWAFLERLCRLVGVLATDDEHGRLVLTNVGETKALGALVYGRNITNYSGGPSGEKRWSHYILKGQAGIGGGGGGGALWSGAGGIYSPGAPAGAVQTAQRVETRDPDVPRYRPHIGLAESQMTLDQMRHRVEWQKRFAFGQSIAATITVPGWRQPNNTLWRVNQMVAVDCEMLGVKQDLLISAITWSLSEAGHETEFTLNPPAAFEPDPNQTRIERAAGQNQSGSGLNWTGVRPYTPSPL